AFTPARRWPMWRGPITSMPRPSGGWQRPALSSTARPPCEARQTIVGSRPLDGHPPVDERHHFAFGVWVSSQWVTQLRYFSRALAELFLSIFSPGEGTASGISSGDHVHFRERR